MASLNKVMLMGNTGRDAELKYLSSGTAKAEFSLAMNYKTKDGDATEWAHVVLFGEQAEKIAEYITKGKQLYVEGRMQTRNWEDDQGTKHYRTEVIANSVQFLDRKPSSDTADDAWE